MANRTDPGHSPLTLALCAATVVGGLAVAPDIGPVTPDQPATSLAAVAAQDVAEVVAPDDLGLGVEPQVLGRMVDRDGELVLGWSQEVLARGRGAAPARSGRTAAAPVAFLVPVAAPATSDRPAEDTERQAGCGADCGSQAPDGAPDAWSDDADVDVDAGTVAGGPGLAAVPPRTTDGDAEDDESATTEKRDKTKKTKKPKKPKTHERGEHRDGDDRDD